jgi:hypothetical protein
LLQIEQVLKDDPFIVGAREKFYIDKMKRNQQKPNKQMTPFPSPL